jgi:hypothetical protein
MQSSGIFRDFQNYFLIGNVMDRVHEPVDRGAGAGQQVHPGPNLCTPSGI